MNSSLTTGDQNRDSQTNSHKDGKQKAFSTDHVNIQDRDKASSSHSVMRNTEKYLGSNSTKHQHSTVNDKGILDSENVFIEDILVNKHRENEREIKRERRY